MPIYEYTCSKCDHRFEKLVRSMTRPQEVQCPECGSSQTARALSVFAVGSESVTKSSRSSEPGFCGRCGGPGPCASM